MSVTCPLCNSKFKYNAYLQTEHWKDKRLLKLSQADNKCQICNSANNLCIHHRVYSNLFNENDNDLIVLCSSCHQLFHKNNTLGSPQNTIAPDIKTLLPKNPTETIKTSAKDSFLRGYHGPEGTFGIPWFDKLPIKKVDIDKFWAEFLIFTKQYSNLIANLLDTDVYTFLGFDTDQDSAFIEHGKDSSFCKHYFDEPAWKEELNKCFKEFCNKKIKIVDKELGISQVIK